MAAGGEAFVTATTERALPQWSERLLAGVDKKTPVAASGEEVLVVAAGGEASFTERPPRGRREHRQRCCACRHVAAAKGP